MREKDKLITILPVSISKLQNLWLASSRCKSLIKNFSNHFLPRMHVERLAFSPCPNFFPEQLIWITYWFLRSGRQIGYCKKWSLEDVHNLKSKQTGAYYRKCQTDHVMSTCGIQITLSFRYSTLNWLCESAYKWAVNIILFSVTEAHFKCNLVHLFPS